MLGTKLNLDKEKISVQKLYSTSCQYSSNKGNVMKRVCTSNSVNISRRID